MFSRTASGVEPHRPLANPRETARYVGAMAVSMRALASDAKLEMLTHLLDLVAEQAQLDAGDQ